MYYELLVQVICQFNTILCNALLQILALYPPSNSLPTLKGYRYSMEDSPPHQYESQFCSMRM